MPEGSLGSFRGECSGARRCRGRSGRWLLRLRRGGRRTNSLGIWQAKRPETPYVAHQENRTRKILLRWLQETPAPMLLLLPFRTSSQSHDDPNLQLP